MFIEVLADNGGGLTLKVYGAGCQCVYQHSYTGYDAYAKDCAVDLREAELVQERLGFSTEGVAEEFKGWEGNELEELGELEPEDEDILNGGYRILHLEDVRKDDSGDSWQNVQDLREQYRAI